jgi:pantoate--beta-alanine ligase
MIRIFAAFFIPMQILRTTSEIKENLAPFILQKKIVGFIPTMGALHKGHLSLIRRSKQECDITVCSIFVNPLQFNRLEDFKNYPETIENDIKLLKAEGCDILFHPDEKEMYPGKIKEQFDFGLLETVMEGRFRPGHFNGVAIAVKRFFEIITPSRAYFGEKDYQQLLIIKKLVEIIKSNIEVVPCPIVRETDGLAMSSRNMRLNEEERKKAPYINKVLKEAITKVGNLNPEELKLWVIGQFERFPGMEFEYIEFSMAGTLEPVMIWEKGQEVIACIAVFLGKVRLIDNIRFIS